MSVSDTITTTDTLANTDTNTTGGDTIIQENGDSLQDVPGDQ